MKSVSVQSGKTSKVVPATDVQDLCMMLHIQGEEAKIFSVFSR